MVILWEDNQIDVYRNRELIFTSDISYRWDFTKEEKAQMNKKTTLKPLQGRQYLQLKMDQGNLYLLEENIVSRTARDYQVHHVHFYYSNNRIQTNLQKIQTLKQRDYFKYINYEHINPLISSYTFHVNYDFKLCLTAALQERMLLTFDLKQYHTLSKDAIGLRDSLLSVETYKEKIMDLFTQSWEEVKNDHDKFERLIMQVEDQTKNQSLVIKNGSNDFTLKLPAKVQAIYHSQENKHRVLLFQLSNRQAYFINFSSSHFPHSTKKVKQLDQFDPQFELKPAEQLNNCLTQYPKSTMASYQNGKEGSIMLYTEVKDPQIFLFSSMKEIPLKMDQEQIEHICVTKPSQIIQGNNWEEQTLMLYDDKEPQLIKGIGQDLGTFSNLNNLFSQGAFLSQHDYLYAFMGKTVKTMYIGNMLKDVKENEQEAVLMEIIDKQLSMTKQKNFPEWERFAFLANHQSSVMVLPYAHLSHITHYGSGLDYRKHRSYEKQAFKTLISSGFTEVSRCNLRYVNPALCLLSKRLYKEETDSATNQYLLLRLKSLEEGYQTLMDFELEDDLVHFSNDMNFVIGLQSNENTLTHGNVIVYCIKQDQEAYNERPIPVHMSNLKTNMFFDEDLELWRRFISPNCRYMVDKFTNDIGH
ncbi:hypothetical protein FGO68_gene9821 [Halteria grandinella]|uniref:Uncharacterized protein n=1 Tax=Halteria grandinella TaxID=5974 RepID=A0A8J8NAF3_HALGN|nr:hypothetical protein FGO68_gene9821 [Halteria grandinella]